MEINGVPIADENAEAFAAPFARLILTATSGKWAGETAVSAAGCATSIIGCSCEAGIEARRDDFKTPDDRPGHELLFFAKNESNLEKELIKRVGQVCLPAPTVSIFNGLSEGKDFPIGKKIGYFGNGFTRSIEKFGKKCVAVPITSGEFLLEENAKIGKGVGGANFWIYASSQKAGLKAAEKAADAIRGMPGLILPFVGGVTASPSRLGSVYDFLNASTQEDYCPTIDEKKNPNRKLPKGVLAIYEIVINAVSPDIAKAAMKAGIEAACVGGVSRIGAASFGGKLGEIEIPLRELF